MEFIVLYAIQSICVYRVRIEREKDRKKEREFRQPYIHIYSNLGRMILLKIDFKENAKKPHR